jgi:hypothetical protein
MNRSFLGEGEKAMDGLLWAWLKEVADILAPYQPLGVLGALVSALAALFTTWRTARQLREEYRRVAIVAVNADSGERKVIVHLPASKVTRAEVLGTMRLAAGGRTLDTSRSTLLEQDFYDIGDEVRVILPASDFAQLENRPAQLAPAEAS